MNPTFSPRSLRSAFLAGSIALALGVSSLGGVTVAQTAATPEAGMGVEVPPDLPPRIGATSAEPLSVNGCTALERSRDEVMAILRTPPRTAPIDHKPTGDEPEVRPSAGYGNGMGVMADEELDAADAVLRQWQVCHQLGLTWQQMSLETEPMIREDIYGDYRVGTAYTDATLTEILDARVEADAAEGAMRMGPGVIASMPPLAIDRDGVTATSAEGDYMIVEVVTVSTHDGKQLLSPAGSVSFWKINGVWLVDRVDVMY